MFNNQQNKLGPFLGLCSMTLMLSSCDATKLVGELSPPSSELKKVDLVSHPNIDQITRYACHEWLDISEFGISNSTACNAAVGSMPNKDNMLFSFDIVFDLQNNNEKVPIPLVEVLLGVSVYNDQNLGAICVSFCDPDTEDCTPEVNAEGGCIASDGENTKDISELFPPPVEGLAELAESAVTGDYDNDSYRVIPAQDSLEAHIQFQFNVDTMLALSENAFRDAGNDIINGRNVSVDVPYTLDGSLFFNIPDLGRYEIGFGPWEDTWTIE